MFQVRIHGRGGQGVVTAAEMLSVAAFIEGKHAQAFPSFGSERMGAPVVAFCRISDREIRLREPIQTPDALIVQDVTLFRAMDVLDGLTPSGFLLVNTSKGFAEIHQEAAAARLPKGHAQTVGATELALAHVGRPAPNTSLLGAFTAFVDIVSLDSVVEAIRRTFPGKVGEANVTAAREAHALVAARVKRETAITEGAAHV
jgi:pyruvate ferredoxin oxidoreductase gamma subunit